MKKLKNLTPLKVIIFTVLLIYSISIIFILCWGFSVSLKSTIDYKDFKNAFGLPNMQYSDGGLFANYAFVWKSFTFKVDGYSYYSLFGQKSVGSYNTDIMLMLMNTIYYAGLLCFVQAFVTLTMGYMTAKYKNKFSTLIIATVYFLMALPIVGSQPSEISLLMDLGVYNTYLGMFIHKFNYGGIYFLVFNAFFAALPDTYIQAAEIDGASQFRVYINIMVPLAAKMLVMVFLIYFIGAWNDYNTIILYYPSYPTLSYGVWRMNNNSEGGEGGSNDVPQKFAAAMVLTIPILIVFFAFRNLIMGNVSEGGIKE